MTQILVVDDSSVIRKVARRILDSMNLDTLDVDNAQDALELCAKSMPDAILLDWNMPVMDGYAFLKVLRRMPGGHRPKVMLCTTENDAAHIARAMNAGANHVLMKPFDKAILQSKLEDIGISAAL